MQNLELYKLKNSINEATRILEIFDRDDAIIFIKKVKIKNIELVVIEIPGTFRKLSGNLGNSITEMKALSNHMWGKIESKINLIEHMVVFCFDL